MDWKCDFNVKGFYMYSNIEMMDLTSINVEEKKKKSTRVYLDPLVYGKPSDDISCSKMIQQIRLDALDCGFDLEYKRKGSKYHFKCRGYRRRAKNSATANGTDFQNNSHNQAGIHESSPNSLTTDEGKKETCSSHKSIKYSSNCKACPFSMSVNLCSTHDLFYVLPSYINNNHKNHPMITKQQEKNVESKSSEAQLKHKPSEHNPTVNLSDFYSGGYNQVIVNNFLFPGKTSLFASPKISFREAERNITFNTNLYSEVEPAPLQKIKRCCILCDIKRKRKHEKSQEQMNKLLDVNRKKITNGEWISNTIVSGLNIGS